MWRRKWCKSGGASDVLAARTNPKRDPAPRSGCFSLGDIGASQTDLSPKMNAVVLRVARLVGKKWLPKSFCKSPGMHLIWQYMHGVLVDSFRTPLRIPWAITIIIIISSSCRSLSLLVAGEDVLNNGCRNIWFFWLILRPWNPMLYHGRSSFPHINGHKMVAHNPMCVLSHPSVVMSAA